MKTPIFCFLLFYAVSIFQTDAEPSKEVKQLQDEVKRLKEQANVPKAILTVRGSEGSRYSVRCYKPEEERSSFFIEATSPSEHPLPPKTYQRCEFTITAVNIDSSDLFVSYAEESILAGGLKQSNILVENFPVANKRMRKTVVLLNTFKSK